VCERVVHLHPPDGFVNRRLLAAPAFAARLASASAALNRQPPNQARLCAGLNYSSPAFFRQEKVVTFIVKL
jgi:hypothetical protein